MQKLSCLQQPLYVVRAYNLGSVNFWSVGENLMKKSIIQKSKWKYKMQSKPPGALGSSVPKRYRNEVSGQDWKNTIQWKIKMISK